MLIGLNESSLCVEQYIRIQKFENKEDIQDAPVSHFRNTTEKVFPVFNSFSMIHEFQQLMPYLLKYSNHND